MKKQRTVASRNPIAKVLHTSNEINARPKVIPNKKGTKSYYSRKGRGKGFDPSFVSTLQTEA